MRRSPNGLRSRFNHWRHERGVRTKVTLIVAVPVIMLLMTAGAFQVSKVQADRSSALVAHTQTVQTRLNYLLGLIVDVETGVRGYLLTGDQRFLAPYDRAIVELPAVLRDIQTLVRDRADQSARVRAVTAATAEDLGVLRQLRALGYSAPDAGRTSRLTSEGKDITDRLRDDVATMLTAEGALLAVRQAAARHWYAVATWLVIGGALLGIGGGLVSARLFTVGISRRLRRSARNAGRMAQGLPLSKPSHAYGDEVGVLDRALTHAARQLQANTAALTEQRRRSAAILEALHDGVAILDLDLRIVDVNPRYCQMLGRERPDVVGARPPFPWWEPEPDERRHLIDRLHELIANGAPLTYEQTITRPDGRPSVVSGTAAPLRDADGRVTGVVSTFTDITDRVAAEGMQRRIEQLQRLDGLGQLAGGVAHDFNNLLVIIGGHARLLSGKLPDDSPLRLSTQRIIEAAGKGDALTRQMLTFARGERHSRTSVDLDVLLGDLQPLLTATLGETVVLRIGGGPECSGLTVAADRSQLEQMVINLAANARDAMPAGGTVTIDWRRANPPGSTAHDPDVEDWVKLAVSDTGSGMDEATKARIFDPFFSTKSLARGTGLGLATVHSVVTKSGGVIRVDSRPGQGSTFEIYLPATAHADAAEPARPVESAEPDIALPEHLRILLVEDQAAVAELVETVLRDAAAEVHTFGRAAGALSALDAGLRVDVLITDVIMPEMTGPQLVAAVHVRDPSLPVLYISGYVSSAFNNVDLGAAAHLVTKPFTADELFGGLRNTLAAASPVSATPSRTSAGRRS
jgi:PAS domain S-box-containing protein